MLKRAGGGDKSNGREIGWGESGNDDDEVRDGGG